MFEVEGRLREHVYLAGELWDMLTLAIYRDKWPDRRRPLLPAEDEER